MKQRFAWFLTILLATTNVPAQTGRSQWQRSTPAQRDPQLLHSVYAVNLPTSETLQKGDFEFEISHRFLSPIAKGKQTFMGIDGPVNMRLGLSYAVSNRFLTTVARSNVTDNWDFQIKMKALQIRNESLPIVVALNGGFAYNDQVFGPIRSNSQRYQYYGQLIINGMIADKIGLGLVPAYLYNSYLYSYEMQHTVTMGSYLQYYLSPNFSLLAEYIPTVSGWRESHNTMTIALEIETGGHFFKIFVTNNAMINPSQNMMGADLEFLKDMRLGFMITRLIKI